MLDLSETPPEADAQFVDHHRDVRPEDFVGKTVARVDTRACNVIRFEFTDGTRLALEAEQFVIQACEACASSGRMGSVGALICATSSTSALCYDRSG